MKFRIPPCLLAFLTVFTWIALDPATARSAEIPPASTNDIRIIELQGAVDLSRAGTTVWTATPTNTVLHAFDRLRTGPQGRLALRWSDQTVIPVGPSTLLEVLPPHESGADSGLHLVEGIISFFHRDKPGRIRIIARGAVAGVEGTEFVVEAAAADSPERTTVSVIDGRVRFGNDLATLVLTNGQQAVIEAGQPPARTPGFVVNNLLQWAFYYPAVLDPADLELTTAEQQSLTASLAAYRSGDLLAALAQYPADRTPSSDSDRLFHAALLLGVGQVAQAETSLAALTAADNGSRAPKLATALRRLIATVKSEPGTPLAQPSLTSELLAESYATQAQGKRGQSLGAALALAKQAASKSPGFGFAWARVAELEFSFGRTQPASAALDKALVLSPRNAQARSLRGFLLAAQSRTSEALAWFDAAIAADSALANAWMGRGLTRIRKGDLDAGREDLLIAAALEPRRAELRNYLGKAFAEDDQAALAAKEVRLAKDLDPNDPNTWLYSALLHQQNNEINAAIRDLEKSRSLNENRSLFRSSELLNQDASVRSGNLARLYQDAGMGQVAQREAARAVNSDYANYATHEFLAANLNWGAENLTSQRYQTPAVNEYAIANLLAPVHAGILSPAVSQSEYSSLFDRNRMGVYSSTEYLDRGAWKITGGQYGVFDGVSYDIYGEYDSEPGQSFNDPLELNQFIANVKLQASPQDTVLLTIDTLHLNSGYLYQTYDPDSVRKVAYNLHESQDVNVRFGLNHEWAPGVNTLVQAGRFSDSYSVYAERGFTYFLGYYDDPATTPDLIPAGGWGFGANTFLARQTTIHSADLQQIWQQGDHTTIAGARFSAGDYGTDLLMRNPEGDSISYLGRQSNEPIAEADFSSTAKMVSLYLYQQWQPIDSLRLIGGVAYDWLDYPTNIWSLPVTPGNDTVDQVSPKAGLVWTPLERSTVRFAYTRSLQGAGLLQHDSLEPTQVAGFVQRFSSLVPEAALGSGQAGRFDTLDLSLEQSFETGTYLAVSLQRLSAKEDRDVGAIQVFIAVTDDIPPTGLREEIGFEERSLQVTFNQLLGEGWSVGADYRLSRADANILFPTMPPDAYLGDAEFGDVVFEPSSNKSALLHQVHLSALFNHPSGFFAGIDGNWYLQRNAGYSTPLPNDSFGQGDLHIGYRFLRRRAEVRVSLLNFTDQNYRLNPLNLYNNLPRDRTLAVRLQFGF
jgi:Tfp pilus assembly protein PilF